MSAEDFERFLECLSPDREQACRRYEASRKKLIGFFSMRGISDPANAADETFDRAALQIRAGKNVPDVEKYCLGIARYIAKERWRREQKESLSFRTFIKSLDEGSAEEVERIQHVLKPCFERLSEEEQKLLRAYCQVPGGRPRAEHRRQLAEAMKMTVTALRIRVTRLRKRLAACVKKRSESSYKP
ncbi:MAG: hypothetical protein M3416_02085 [Acidobacteriota bacterium]|nr:hypothetical protein [Acidobacteriota bacterium]